MGRLYSSSELKFIEQELHKRYRLSDTFATHIPCLHRYRVKKGGRKEQQLLNSDSSVLDDQTCSVCFKLRCTNEQPDIEIEYILQHDGENPSLELLKNKNTFYKWLYERVD